MHYHDDTYGRSFVDLSGHHWCCRYEKKNHVVVSFGNPVHVAVVMWVGVVAVRVEVCVRYDDVQRFPGVFCVHCVSADFSIQHAVGVAAASVVHLHITVDFSVDQKDDGTWDETSSGSVSHQQNAGSVSFDFSVHQDGTLFPAFAVVLCAHRYVVA